MAGTAIDRYRQYLAELAVALNKDTDEALAEFARTNGMEMPAHPITRKLTRCKLQVNTPGVSRKVQARAREWIRKCKFSEAII